MQQFVSILFPESWTKQGCISLCVSEISQNDANLCALAQASQCRPPTICIGNECVPGGEDNIDPPTDDPFEPPTLFFNSSQEESVECPDGSLYSFTVPAGTFSASTQAGADARAAAYALEKAIEQVICIGELTNPGACVGTLYTGIVGLTNPSESILFVSLDEGVLPPGTTLEFTQQSFTVTGIPTTIGQYDFTIRVDDVNGNTILKSFSIFVVEITQDNLPDGSVGTAYSQTLTTTGPTEGVIEWSVTSGALPGGLTLNAVTGAITGTPTVVGTFNFTIGFTDER